MKDQTYWVLNYLNAHRSEEDLITLENAKGRHLPKERLEMAKAPYRDAVNQVLGEPSFLEKAEMLFLEMEEENLTEQEKWNCLMNIFYVLPCDTVEVKIMERIEKYDHAGVTEFVKEKLYISETWLEGQKNEYFSEEAQKEPEKKFFLEYLFQLTYFSLKEVFNKTKSEFLGQ